MTNDDEDDCDNMTNDDEDACDNMTNDDKDDYDNMTNDSEYDDDSQLIACDQEDATCTFQHRTFTQHKRLLTSMPLSHRAPPLALWCDGGPESLVRSPCFGLAIYKNQPCLSLIEPRHWRCGVTEGPKAY
ncbi:hypothetical protein PoB_001525700 [Plakobranchus ocellatus]|uniref:Uncharacterized protein n=1 Tax=Plakobranchus ocellatus TaxID=259542 RepID=A0AAV3Z2J5_9GAST|nr:hypothetical protein PoB_001525700 [Plakobranchus ocellatus]